MTRTNTGGSYDGVFRTHMGVEKAELPVDAAEYLDSEPDMENPNDDPTRRPD